MGYYMPMRMAVDKIRAVAARASDPLNLLIAAQALFLAVGIFRLDFSISWLAVVVAVIAAVATELLCANIPAFRGKAAFSLFVPRSAVAAALGIGIFFRANEIWYFALAASFAILSKYAIRVQGKHIFNPSNLAIVALVFLLPSATTIEFTQWGNNPALYIAVALISLAIAYRAGVFPITAAFIGSYAALLLAFVGVAPDIFAPHHYGLIGPSLIMFASFMITDPKTAPRGIYAGLLHGAAVACAYFSLEGLGVQYALFAASFLIAGFNALSRVTGFESLKNFVFRSASYSSVPNLMTTLVLAALCIGVYAHLRIAGGEPANPRPVAMQFLLMGVESEGLHACARDAAFERKKNASLTHGTATTGAAWGDYDNDGDDDLLITYLDAPSTLLTNTGGSLHESTMRLRLPSASSGFFVDYDNDGNLDIILFGTPRSEAESSLSARGITVYKNKSGTFTDATVSTGLDRYSSPEAAGVTATFSDFDKDGLLDVIVSQNSSRFELYAQNREAFKKMLANPAIRQSSLATCEPATVKNLIDHNEKLRTSITERMSLESFYAQRACFILQGTIALSDVESRGNVTLKDEGATIVDALALLPGSVRAYRNVGGSFAEKPSLGRTVDEILEKSAAKSSVFAAPGTHPYPHISGAYFQPVAFDYDEDGRTDLFIAVDYGSNLLLTYRGNWVFEDRTSESNIDYYSNGMGVDVSDYDRDGHLDLLVTNTLEDYLFKNAGGVFENMTLFTDFARTGLGWGVSFLDYDLDGHEDIFITNGDSVRNNDAPDGALTRPLFRSDNLYRNRGDGTYADMNGADLCSDAESGRALAVSDYDNDGDPDVFVGNREWESITKPQNALYTNRTLPGKAHFLKVRLRGTFDNTFGVGSIVRVESSDGVQKKILLAGSSFRSQNSGDLLFGLGEDNGPVVVHILWPSGRETTLHDVAVDRTLTVRQ